MSKIIVCLLSMVVLLLPNAYAKTFNFKDVKQKAKELSNKSYESLNDNLPDAILNMGYDQWRDIRFKDESTLWGNDKSSFKLRFFHPGFNFKQPVVIHYVDNTGVHDYPFDSTLFNYGRTGLETKVPKQGTGFAGFRVHYPLNKPDYLDELVAFLGASYFRALSKNVQYGMSARGLAINMASDGGEEFPLFKEFWIIKPSNNAKAITIYALLDSASVTGAYEYIVTPGVITVMKVKSTLFFRQNIAKLGLAPLTSMYFYGENTKEKGQNDFRPEVHDSDGVLIQTKNDEWIWRPLDNPQKLSINAFYVDTPKGFGLLQRDENFDHYLDLEARYEARPSAWVIPENWGAGHVEVVQIPAQNEYNDNINAFWVPEKQPQAGDTRDFNYELQWYSAMSKELPLAFASSTHINKNDKVTQFIIEFHGEEIEALPGLSALNATINVSKGYRVTSSQVFKNVVTRGWRVVFKIEEEESFMKDILPTSKPVAELDVVLKDNNKVLSETWTYSLRP